MADGYTGLQIIDISGIDTPAISAGNISAGDITVTENADIGNNLYVRNGLNVGSGGIKSDGEVNTDDVLKLRPTSQPTHADEGDIYCSSSTHNCTATMEPPGRHSGKFDICTVTQKGSPSPGCLLIIATIGWFVDSEIICRL